MSSFLPTVEKDKDEYKIPKIIHQFWIGDQSKRPTVFLDSWRMKHLDWEYILWSEEEIAQRGITFECQRQIDEIPEINGKADIIRWEILNRYGGVAMDADSFCLERMEPEFFLTKNGWSVYENEQARKGLIACGAMGFPPKHPVVIEMIEYIKKLDLHPSKCNLRAWMTVAVKPFTEFLNSGKYNDFAIFPSFMFIPHHFTGVKYNGHKRVYAYQEWGSTKQNYHLINTTTRIPRELYVVERWVSVVLPTYNTPQKYIHDCLESIKGQQGDFGIEIVIVDDGSDLEHKKILDVEISIFLKSSRFIKIELIKLNENVGIAVALNKGLAKCNFEIVFRMDADDIMLPTRLLTQLKFMDNHPDCIICGANIQFFKEDDNYKKVSVGTPTKHPQVLTWEQYKKNPSEWFMNHPTFCMRKTKIVDMGGYNENLTRIPMEDLDLELRVLKTYGKIYNLQDILLNYRLHAPQISNKNRAKWAPIRTEMIQSYIQ